MLNLLHKGYTMKLSPIKRSIFLGGSLVLFIGFFVYIFFDAFFGSNFRSTQDPLLSSQQVNLAGLKQLHASGGASVRFPDLKKRLNHIKGTKIIVDAMAQFHGYVNGISTTFFAYHKPPTLRQLIRRWILTGTTDVRPDLVISEEIEAKNNGFGYEKVNIGSTFTVPDEDIDKIVDFYNNLPEDTWLHFHCIHGKGRTSMLLVMYDIMKNAPSVSVKDIVKRQHLLGSENLFDTEVWKYGTYTKERLENRKKFVEEFYAFVCQRKAGGTQLWSEWHHQQKVLKRLSKR